MVAVLCCVVFTFLHYFCVCFGYDSCLIRVIGVSETSSTLDGKRNYEDKQMEKMQACMLLCEHIHRQKKEEREKAMCHHAFVMIK